MIKLIGGMLVAAALTATTFYIIDSNKPTKKEYNSTHYDAVCKEDKCEVFFSSSIDEQSNYRWLIKTLETADKGDVITFHLAGNGGSTDTILYIHNAVRFSKATVNTVIEGPVYSAHAYLAMIGQKITIGRNVFFMFHSPAVSVQSKEGSNALTLDQFCDLMKDKMDRGRSFYDKCIIQNTFYKRAIDNYFQDYADKFLTKEEIKNIKDGYDVYIDGEDMRARLEDKS